MGVVWFVNLTLSCLIAMESVDALDEEDWWLEPEEREARGRGGKRKNEEGVTSKKKRRKISEMIKLSKVNLIMIIVTYFNCTFNSLRAVMTCILLTDNWTNYLLNYNHN